MVRAFAMYEPLKIFVAAGLLLIIAGAAPIARFLVRYFAGDGSGMIQSLLLGGVFVLMGVMAIMFAFIADLIAFNRQLLEISLEKIRKIDADLQRLRDAEQPFPEARLRAELETLETRRRSASGGD